MTKRITIPYFPKGLKHITPLFFAIGAYLVFQHLVLGLMLWLVSIMILTTHYATEINLKEKCYKDYFSFFGLQLKKKFKRFNQLDRIIITKENFSQTINTRAQTRQLNWSDYTGTLLYDNNDHLALMTRSDKRELLMVLKEFAGFLNVQVEDRTTGQYFWIDMEKA